MALFSVIVYDVVVCTIAAVSGAKRKRISVDGALDVPQLHSNF